MLKQLDGKREDKYDRRRATERAGGLGRTSYPPLALWLGLVWKSRHGRGSRSSDLRAGTRTHLPVRRRVAPRQVAFVDTALHLAERTPLVPYSPRRKLDRRRAHIGLRRR